MATNDPQRYSTLLRVRKRQEDAEAMRLAAIERKRRAAEAERSEIERNQRLTFERASEVSRGRFDASTVLEYHHYERLLSELAVMKDSQARQLAESARDQRSVVEDAWKRRRTVELMMERLEAAQREELRRGELRAMDEFTSIRTARGSRPLSKQRKTE